MAPHFLATAFSSSFTCFTALTSLACFVRCLHPAFALVRALTAVHDHLPIARRPRVLAVVCVHLVAQARLVRAEARERGLHLRRVRMTVPHVEAIGAAADRLAADRHDRATVQALADRLHD